MRHRLWTVLAFAATLTVPPESCAQSAADSAAIRGAALDYIEGWYEGSAERMTRAVHPRLAKRIVEADRQSRRSVLDEMTATELIEGTRRGGGKRTPEARRRTDVRILDVFGGTASVRVDADAWVDYMHLARVDGEWKILNVLWERRPRPSGG